VDDVWVVFRCQVGASEQFFAWCRPSRNSPGFEEIYYTKRDGLTAWSPSGDGVPPLGEHVCTITFPREGDAPTGARFPETPVAAPTPVVEAGPSAGSPEPERADAGAE
jgi:hypothetical protein